MAIESYSYDRTLERAATVVGGNNIGWEVDGVKLTGSTVPTSQGVWGSYIPLSEGYRAVDGAVIWAGTPYKADERYMVQRIADGGLMAISYRNWNIKRSCAFALGYRLNPTGAKPKVRRVWVGGELAYSEGNSMPVKYSNFQKQYIPNGQYVNGVWVPNSSENTSGNTFGDVYWNFNVVNDSGRPVGTVAWDEDGNMLGQSPLKSTIKFRFHDGSEDQEPDPAILAELGSDATSFRGLMYIVIEDLIVGQGSEQNNIFAPDVAVTGSTKTGSQRVEGGFPAIRVELVDGSASVVYKGNFKPNSGANKTEQGLHIVANWDTSELITIAPTDGGGYLHRYDIDNKNETYTKYIPGIPGEKIGYDVLVWDTVNDFLFTQSLFEGSRDKFTIKTDGTIITSGLGTGYTPSNGDPWTEQNPSDRSTHWKCCDLAYMVVNGELKTIVCGHGYEGHGAALHLRKDGTFSNLIYPRQAFDIPAGHTFSSGLMKALPLHVHATQDQHLSYQDVCFVHCYGDVHSTIPGGVRLIFVGMDSDNVPRIKGFQTLITGDFVGSSFSCVLDVAGNLIVQENLQDKVTKFSIDYLGEPDYTVAPGWRGLFPRVTATKVHTFAASTTPDLWGVTYANVTNNIVYSGGRYLDMSTMQTSVVGDSSYNFTGLWDSTRGTMFFTGTMSAPETGKGLLWATIISGLLGNIGTLAGVLQDISVAAGYSVGQLNIDGGLTTGVPGVLITGPTDLGSLFSNMGVIYEFGYFNSGGKLTFRSSTNTPIYATGYVQVQTPYASHINVQDGDTVTIGTITYRFKATPSAPFDVKLGVDESIIKPNGFLKSLCNLYAAIKGDSTLGADAVPFFAGTVVNSSVSVKFDAQSAVTGTNGQMLGYGKLIITSNVGGTTGNSIALAQTGGRLTISGANLVGGEEIAAPGATITLDQMCMLGENQITDTDALVTSIPPPGAAQQAASVSYYALEQDYQRATQTFTPDNLGGALPDATLTTPYPLPIVMSTSEAYSRVSHVGFAAGSMTITQEFRLPQAYLGIEPNDVLSVVIPPFSYTVRVDEATFNGDFSMSISATNFDARTDVPINNSDSRASVPQAVPSAGDALPLFLDAPQLDVLGGAFPGVIDLNLGMRPFFSSYRSAIYLLGEGSAEPAQLFSSSEPVKWGKLGAELPAFVYPGHVIEDDSSITVVCRSLNYSRDLQDATDELSFLAGENCVAVGSGTSWEYVYFRTVELVATGIVKLKGLIRAQRGTDVAAASHTFNDVVVLVASANPTFKTGLRLQSIDAAKAGTSYKAVASGNPTSKPPYQEVNVLHGYNLYPFSPCQFSATKDGSNNITLGWVRRDRLGTEFVTDAQPLSETSEKYDVEIMNGSTVVRTLTDLTSPSYTYSAANQTADGFSPPMATIKFRVYQKGELGRGFAHEETVNVD